MLFQIKYQFKTISVKILAAFFFSFRKWKTDPKIYMEI